MTAFKPVYTQNTAVKSKNEKFMPCCRTRLLWRQSIFWTQKLCRSCGCNALYSIYRFYIIEYLFKPYFKKVQKSAIPNYRNDDLVSLIFILLTCRSLFVFYRKCGLNCAFFGISCSQNLIFFFMIVFQYLFMLVLLIFGKI